MTENSIACPTCTSDEHLRGERHGGIIRITCAACHTQWERDPAPRCPTCGSSDVRPVPQAVVERVRGNQVSVTGIRTVYLCPSCDAQRWQRHTETNTPLPPDHNPTAGLK